MDSLFNNDAKQVILNRINKLTPDTKGQWGKMDVAQMLAHCGQIMEVAIADKKLPRTFSGRFVGPFVKQFLFNDSTFPKNSPTDPNFKIVDQKDFKTEKERLLNLVNRFQEKGEQGLTKHKHPFFGSLTNNQWGMASYKHLSYHLNQFGV